MRSVTHEGVTPEVGDSGGAEHAEEAAPRQKIGAAQEDGEGCTRVARDGNAPCQERNHSRFH